MCYSPEPLAAVFARQRLWLLLPGFPILIGSAAMSWTLNRLNRQHSERGLGGSGVAKKSGEAMANV